MNHLVILASETAGHENNFFYGDVKEVIVASVASVILIGLMWWKGMPAARQMLQDRSDRIAKELGDAEKVRHEAEGVLADVQGRIANADQERQRIIVEARQTAEALKTQILARAEADAASLKVRAAADIESSKHQAIADLQSEVGALAMGAAEAVITQNLDAATQSDLIDGYITQVGAGTSGAGA